MGFLLTAMQREQFIDHLQDIMNRLADLVDTVEDQRVVSNIESAGTALGHIHDRLSIGVGGGWLNNTVQGFHTDMYGAVISHEEMKTIDMAYWTLSRNEVHGD